MKNLILKALILTTVLALLFIPKVNFGQAPNLGTTVNYAMFTSIGAVGNTGSSMLTGNVGTNNGSFTGFGNVNGRMENSNGSTAQASADLLAAYNQLNGTVPNFFIAPLLGNGDTLITGVYSITGATVMNLNLILDAQGDPNAIFIFQISGPLSTNANSKVILLNGAMACNVYWKIEGLVSMGPNTNMKGTVVVNNAAIEMNAGDTLEGRVLSTTGAITIDGTMIYTPIGCFSLHLTGPAIPALNSTACYTIFSSDGPVTNVGVTHITGDIGTNVGLTTGYDSLVVIGTIHPIPDGSTAAVAADLLNLYNNMNLIQADIELLYPAQFGMNLVLTPHTYIMNTGVTFTDSVFLNAQGDMNAVFVIQILGALSTSTFSEVILVNGTQAKNVFWVINGAVDINDYSIFNGTIICNNGAINIRTGVVLNGRAMTTTGTINTAAITDIMPPGCIVATPCSIRPEIIASGPTTFCNGGSVTLSTDVFDAYQWNTGATTDSILVTAGGTYIVTVVYNNGCIGTDTIDVVVNTNPIPAITGITTACAGSCVTLTAGTWMTYLWTNSDSTSITSICSTGNNCVTVTDTNGCIGSVCVDVTIYDNPIPIITGITSACSGSCVTLDAGSWATYMWTNGDMTPITSVCSTGNNCVTVTDANGCIGTTCITVTINTNPAPTITANGPTTFCNGDSVGLDAGAYTSFLWNTGSTDEITTAYGSQPYCVTVTDTNGCIGSDCIFITVDAIPTATISGPSTICNGSSATLNAGGGTSYLWSSGETTQGISTTTSGTYCVTVSSGFGCTAATCQLLTVLAPVVPVITSNSSTTFCQGDSVTLDAGVYASYLWSNGSTMESIAVMTSNTYSVTVTDVNGCMGSAVQLVTVSANAIPTILTNGPTMFCQGGSVTLDAGAFASYIWSNGSTMESINAMSSATYTVTVTNAQGCTGTASQMVTVVPPITGLAITGPASACAGGSVTLTTGAYSSYLWSNGATTQSISAMTTGIYYLTVSNIGNCTAVAHRSVTILSAPVPNIFGFGLATLCGGGSATLTVGQSFAAYSWNTSAVTQGITINSAGTYSVTVTSTNGCTGTGMIVTSGCNIPANAATPTTAITATTAMANWIQPVCYYNYTIRRSVHNTNVWTSFTFSPNNHYTFSGLTHNTAYDWQIQTNCNASATVNSGFSVIQTFTTAPRLEGGDEQSISTFTIYPNPANESATIAFSSANEGSYAIILYNIIGSIARTETGNAGIGENTHVMNLNGIAKGIYIAELRMGDTSSKVKLIVQ